MNSGGYGCDSCGKYGMDEFEARVHGCGGKKPDEAAPMEWWIKEDKKINPSNRVHSAYDVEQVNCFSQYSEYSKEEYLAQLTHVIEKSVYDCVCAQLAAANEAGIQVTMERDALRAQNRDLLLKLGTK